MPDSRKRWTRWVTVGAAIALGGLLLGTVVPSEIRGPMATAVPPLHHPGLTPFASWTTFYAPWHGENNVNKSGSGCSTFMSYSEQAHMAGTSSGAVLGNYNIGVSPSSPCSVGYTVMDTHAGTHVCVGINCPSYSSYFTPATTGFYTLSATWEFSMYVGVEVYASAAGLSGNSLTQYAEVNLTTGFAIYNQTGADGWIVPNSFTSIFHIDSRDMTTIYTSLSDQIFFDRKITQTVTTSTLCYLWSGASYEPRALLDMYGFAVGIPGYNSDIWFNPITLNPDTVATLNSVSIA